MEKPRPEPSPETDRGFNTDLRTEPSMWANSFITLLVALMFGLVIYGFFFNH